CHPSGTPPVAGSFGSGVRLTMTFRTAAASATVRPCGPMVSCVCEIGTTPARLVRPTVGLMPTTLLTFAGQTMLPSVSVPIDTAGKLADGAAAEPELEPQALRSSEYGLWVRPPRPDQPLVEKKERKFAHSERFVLPRMTAPPARSFPATVESATAGLPSSARGPPGVCLWSPGSLVSLSRAGVSRNGARTT